MPQLEPIDPLIRRLQLRHVWVACRRATSQLLADFPQEGTEEIPVLWVAFPAQGVVAAVDAVEHIEDRHVMFLLLRAWAIARTGRHEGQFRHNDGCRLCRCRESSLCGLSRPAVDPLPHGLGVG